jgi:hypothetical protein
MSSHFSDLESETASAACTRRRDDLSVQIPRQGNLNYAYQFRR